MDECMSVSWGHAQLWGKRSRDRGVKGVWLEQLSLATSNAGVFEELQSQHGWSRQILKYQGSSDGFWAAAWDCLP